MRQVLHTTSMVLMCSFVLLGCGESDAKAVDVKPLETTRVAEVLDFEHALVTSYVLEVAVTDKERATGLMFRTEMAQNKGMLFEWNEPAPYAMWMKNTYIPLDMLFVREGRIVDMEQNTKTQSLDSLGGRVDVDSVIELNAGQIKEHGIKIGYSIQYQD